MAEYIERKAAFAKIKGLKGPTRSPAQNQLIQRAMIDIAGIPAADVEPVVRCKDCKHYHASEGWCDEHSSFIDGRGVKCHPWESSEWRMFNEDDFCSYGE